MKTLSSGDNTRKLHLKHITTGEIELPPLRITSDFIFFSESQKMVKLKKIFKINNLARFFLRFFEDLSRISKKITPPSKKLKKIKVVSGAKRRKILGILDHILRQNQYVLARSAENVWLFLETISKKITSPDFFSLFSNI